MNMLTRRALRLAYYAFEKAIALDPGFAEAQAALAMTYATDLTGSNYSWNDWVRSPARSRNQAVLLAQKALVLAELGHSRFGLRSHQPRRSGLHEGAGSCALSTRSRTGECRSICHASSGANCRRPPREALESIKEALHRDPKGPPSTYATLGTVQFALHDYRNATASLEQAFAAMVDGGSWFYSPFLYSAWAIPVGQFRIINSTGRGECQR